MTIEWREANDKREPKLLTDIPENLDILITMGCNVVCPFVPNQYTEDWGLDDPSDGPIEEFKKTRDIIKVKVQQLVKRVKSGEIKINHR